MNHTKVSRAAEHVERTALAVVYYGELLSKCDSDNSRLTVRRNLLEAARNYGHAINILRRSK